MKLLYVPLGLKPNDFFTSFCKYFDAKIYTSAVDAYAFKPDVVHFHSGSLSIEEAALLKSVTGKAIWTQFSGDCDIKPLEPVMRYHEYFDYTFLTIAEGMKDLYPVKNLTWMPEAVTEPKQPKVMTGGKIRFVGNYYGHFPAGNARKELCQFLSKHYSDDFECYGNFHVEGVNCKGTLLYERVMDLYNDSFIVIAHDNFTDVNKYFTQRYLAMGTSCVLGLRSKGLPIGKSLITFDTLDYLKTVIDLLYSNPNLRNETAMQGYNEVKENWTYDRWTERYISIITK